MDQFNWHTHQIEEKAKDSTSEHPHTNMYDVIIRISTLMKGIWLENMTI